MTGVEASRGVEAVPRSSGKAIVPGNPMTGVEASRGVEAVPSGGKAAAAAENSTLDMAALTNGATATLLEIGVVSTSASSGEGEGEGEREGKIDRDA